MVTWSFPNYNLLCNWKSIRIFFQMSIGEELASAGHLIEFKFTSSLKVKFSSLVTFKDIVQYTKMCVRSSSLWRCKNRIWEISAIYDNFEDWSLKVTSEPSYGVMLNCNLSFDLKMAEFRGFFYAQWINQH